MVFKEVSSLLHDVVSTYEGYIERFPYNNLDMIEMEPLMSKKVHTFLSLILDNDGKQNDQYNLCLQYLQCLSLTFLF